VLGPVLNETPTIVSRSFRSFAAAGRIAGVSTVFGNAPVEITDATASARRVFEPAPGRTSARMRGRGHHMRRMPPAAHQRSVQHFGTGR
jgi:hypothetical protein